MSLLFHITDKKVFPNPETLLIEPFKSIWKRDKTIDKWQAMEDFAYCEFVSSMQKSNPFRGYPEEKKEEIVKDAIITRTDWKQDVLIKDCIKSLKVFQSEASSTYSYYMSVKKATENMTLFFNNVNLTETNERTGNPLYKPKDITSAAVDTEKVIVNLKALEKRVDEELMDVVKNKSQKQISIFASGDFKE